MEQAIATTNVAGVPLPYGPIASRVLEPLRRVFRPVNVVIVPALNAGLGTWISNPLTGYLMVLRTRGRRTGRIREVPLGYVIRDGAIYCCAGFGMSTAWYRNLVSDAAVQVVLPGRILLGTAMPVTDRDEWIRAYRALMDSLGLVSRLAMGDLRSIDDATLRRRHGAIPLVRITPTGILSGGLDPGGRSWLLGLAVWLLVPALIARCRRR